MELARSVCQTHAQIVGAQTLFMTPKLQEPGIVMRALVLPSDRLGVACV